MKIRTIDEILKDADFHGLRRALIVTALPIEMKAGRSMSADNLLAKATNGWSSSPSVGLVPTRHRTWSPARMLILISLKFFFSSVSAHRGNRKRQSAALWPRTTYIFPTAANTPRVVLQVAPIPFP